jgi:hypothetical protein
MAGSNGVDLTRQGVQDIANLTLEGKREAATSALQSLGSSGVEVKKEIATSPKVPRVAESDADLGQRRGGDRQA